MTPPARRLPDPRAVRKFARSLAAFSALVALVLVPRPAAAATLSPGDLVVIEAPEWDATHSILRVDPNTGAPLETITSGGLLVDPRGLYVMPSGMILVADHVAGLLQVDPTTGAQSVLVAPAGFGGAGPTGVAREAGGNLVVVCGDASGIWRVTPTGAVLGAFSSHGTIAYANAIAVAPDGNLWIADGNNGVFRVDPVFGMQFQLGVTGVDFETPDGIAVGKGGSPFYVLMRGRFNYGLYGGAYAVDPASGVGTRVDNTFEWVEGVAVDPVSGAAFVTTVYDIENGAAQYGRLVKGAGGAWSVISPDGQRMSGPLAVVPPPDATPAVPTSWGRIKAMMR